MWGAVCGLRRAATPGASAQPGASGGTDDLAEARRHFELGIVHFDRGEWQAALAEFSKSRELAPTRANTKNAAICLRKVGRFDESLALFETLLRDYPNLPEADRELAQREIAELVASIGTFELTGAPAGARVTVDGAARGTTPLAGPLRLSAGTHVVRVEKSGYLPFETRVELAGREAKKTRVVLVAVTHAGRLHVTEKSGRTTGVFVDGVRVGTAPWSGALAPGVHGVWLGGGGELGAPPTRVELSLGREVHLELAAVPLGSELEVRAKPDSAAIAVDGVPVGRGPFTGRLAPGSHRVAVTHEGHAPFARTVTLIEHERELVTVALERESPSRVLAELEAGVPLGLLWGGELESSCTEPCTSSVAYGFYAQAHAVYRVPSGVGLGVFAGYLRMSKTLEGRAEAFTPGGKPTNTGTVDDRLRLAGVLMGAEADYATGSRWPITARIGLGALVGALTDTRTGTMVDSSGSSYAVSTTQYPRASYLFIAPELRIGHRLGTHFEVSAGTKLLVLAALTRPAWNPEPGVIAGSDGLGKFKAADMTGGLMLALLPGVSLTYAF